MSDVLSYDGPKLAGLQALFFAQVRALQPLPDLDEDGLSLLGNVQLVPGTTWSLLQGTIYTPALDVVAAVTVHGAGYEQELTGFYAGDLPAVASQFLKMQGRRFVLLALDFEGRVRLVGDPRGGLEFTYKQTSGTKPGERKGYAWSFKGRTAGPALFYTGTMPAQLPGGGGAPPASGGVVLIYTSRGRFLGTARAGQRVTITSPFRVTITIV